MNKIYAEVVSSKKISPTKNIFLDLGFSDELSEKLMEEAHEIAMRRKIPDTAPFLDLINTLKKKKAKYERDASDTGDRRDWDGSTEAWAKIDMIEEVIELIKTMLNDLYGTVL